MGFICVSKQLDVISCERIRKGVKLCSASSNNLLVYGGINSAFASSLNMNMWSQLQGRFQDQSVFLQPKNVKQPGCKNFRINIAKLSLFMLVSKVSSQNMHFKSFLINVQCGVSKFQICLNSRQTLGSDLRGQFTFP